MNLLGKVSHLQQKVLPNSEQQVILNTINGVVIKIRLFFRFYLEFRV